MGHFKKVTEQMRIEYTVDQDTGIYYERLIGKNVSIDEFQKHLLNPEHMHTAFGYKVIIVDFQHITLDIDDQEAYSELFDNHIKVLESTPTETEKFAIVISHTNELFFSSQLKEQLDAVKGVRSKYFLTPEAVNDYVGCDVSALFLMNDGELSEYKLT